MGFQTAFFENLEMKGRPGSQMRVQFNPAELAFSKTAQFAEIAIPGLDQPVLQFIRGGTETLAVELFFDTTDGGIGDNAKSVTEQTDQFYRLVKQDPDLHAPPRCRFSWGEPTVSVPVPGVPAPALPSLPGAKDTSKAPFWFNCIVEGVDRKFTLFSPQGTPLRARLSVKMREYQTVDQMVRKLNSADHTKARSFRRRERLDQIAAEEYGSPAEWRRIAIENQIENPLEIVPGTILKVPPMTTDSILKGNS